MERNLEFLTQNNLRSRSSVGPTGKLPRVSASEQIHLLSCPTFFFFFLPLLSACNCSHKHFPGLVHAPRATSLPAPPRGRPSPAPSADLRSLLPIHGRDPGHRGGVLAQPPPALTPRGARSWGVQAAAAGVPEFLRWENPGCPSRPQPASALRAALPRDKEAKFMPVHPASHP